MNEFKFHVIRIVRKHDVEMKQAFLPKYVGQNSIVQTSIEARARHRRYGETYFFRLW